MDAKNTNKGSITFEDSLLNDGLINANTWQKLKESKLKLLSKNMSDISDKITKEIIKNSKYLFKWVKVFNNEK